MTKQQAHNLVYFTFMCRFNTESHVRGWGRNAHDITYINEKWEKLIGVKPVKPDYVDVEEIDHIKSEWIITWMISRSLTIEESCIMNYIIAVSRISLLKITFDDMVFLFEKYIGNKEDISNEEYRHIHPLSLDHWNKFIEKNKRSINLQILADGLQAKI